MSDKLSTQELDRLGYLLREGYNAGVILRDKLSEIVSNHNKCDNCKFWFDKGRGQGRCNKLSGDSIGLNEPDSSETGLLGTRFYGQNKAVEFHTMDWFSCVHFDKCQ